MSTEQDAPCATIASSVARKMLDEFLSQLEQQNGYGDIAKRLRTAIFSKTGFNESSVRNALFEAESK
jgi:hypothetical protein